MRTRTAKVPAGIGPGDLFAGIVNLLSIHIKDLFYSLYSMTRPTVTVSYFFSSVLSISLENVESPLCFSSAVKIISTLRSFFEVKPAAHGNSPARRPFDSLCGISLIQYIIENISHKLFHRATAASSDACCRC